VQLRTPLALHVRLAVKLGYSLLVQLLVCVLDCSSTNSAAVVFGLSRLVVVNSGWF
jgi:hypothetical protein